MSCPLKVKEPECNKCPFSKYNLLYTTGVLATGTAMCNFPFIGGKKVNEVRIWRENGSVA